MVNKVLKSSHIYNTSLIGGSIVGSIIKLLIKLQILITLGDIKLWSIQKRKL